MIKNKKVDTPLTKPPHFNLVVPQRYFRVRVTQCKKKKNNTLGSQFSVCELQQEGLGNSSAQVKVIY